MGMDVLLLTHAQFSIAIIPGVGQGLPLGRMRHVPQKTDAGRWKQDVRGKKCNKACSFPSVP